MADELIDADQIAASYQSYLMAKIQLAEFSSWGSSITDTFRKTIASHQESENRYLAQQLKKRSS